MKTSALAAAILLFGCRLPSAVNTGGTLLPLTDDISSLFQFYFGEGKVPVVLGGHGFVVERPGADPVALTAHHVGGALPIAPDDSEGHPGVVAFLQSPVVPLTLRLGTRIQLSGAQTINRSSSQADVAAFRIKDTTSIAGRMLRLADTRPAVGDTVWVLAVHFTIPSNFDPRAGPRRHPARVEVSHDSAFIYSYLRSYNANLTSGAAVLDRDGRVVGINVGTLTASAGNRESWRTRYGPCCDGAGDGVVVGLAVNTSSVKAMLARAQ